MSKAPGTDRPAEERPTVIPLWRLRAHFAVQLAELYGAEVPGYRTLVDVSAEVNAERLATDPDAERLGSIGRVTAERHGAIRVGNERELRQVGRIFAAMGMYPVGFYDLRSGSAGPIPVVSTAFRPIAAEELARNPFRMFVSVLTSDDRRFFHADLQHRVDDFLAGRVLFSEELFDLAGQAVAQDGLPSEAADRFVQLAVGSLALSPEPVDEAWYRELESVSGVAADIAGVRSTHVNHLTPRVLDIDALYTRMTAKGVEMIDEIQGPPRWGGPDLLLRQTSFRALAEPRRMRGTDGTIRAGTLRVRFGEVEQRGIALTPSGRDLVDSLQRDVDELAHAAGQDQDPAAIWRATVPGTERGLLDAGLAYFTFHRSGASPPRLADVPALGDLLDCGAVVARPIVYEDFLPRSAAGIFRSNLTDTGRAHAEVEGSIRDLDWLSGVLDAPVYVPETLYAEQREASLAALNLGHGTSYSY